MLKSENEMMRIFGDLSRALRDPDALRDEMHMSLVLRYVTTLMVVTADDLIRTQATAVETALRELDRMMRHMHYFGVTYSRDTMYYGNPYADVHSEWIKRDSATAQRLMTALADLIDSRLINTVRAVA